MQPVSNEFEWGNKVVDRTVVRYLKKRIDNKMEKELSDAAHAIT